MHIGLDLLFHVPGHRGGRETYVRELMAALRAVRPDLRMTVFVNRAAERVNTGFWRHSADDTVVLPRVDPHRRGRWALGEVVLLPRVAARLGVDVLHSPANFAPLSGPFARVVTLHDLLFRCHPERLQRIKRMRARVLIPPAVRRAHRVITVSETSKSDIVARLRVPPDRVDVVPNGRGQSSERPGDPDAGRVRLGVGGRALALSVAADLRHKNLSALLDGLAAMAPNERPVLAFVGRGTDRGALPARVRKLGLEGDVRLVGPVESGELEDLYAAAALLVTATRYEGFGLPVLEAMARGVLVACSDIPVLREVAGDGAAYLDPGDPASIAGAMHRLLAGGPDVDRLRAAGRTRAASHSWRNAAVATAGVYEQALAAARRNR